MNPGVAILFSKDGSASITVNCDGHVWALDCLSPADAATRAVEARLLDSDQAEDMVRQNKGYMGSPLQYYPPALRQSGFREYPVQTG